MTIEFARKELIKRFEGLELSIYLDSAGKKTIGWGHLVKTSDNITYPFPLVRITRAQADQIFNDDYNALVKQLDLPKDLSEHEVSAIISLVFNIGVGQFRNSTLRQLLLKGKIYEAGSQILRWNHTGKDVNPGLLKRRSVEFLIFSEIRDFEDVRINFEDEGTPEHELEVTESYYAKSQNEIDQILKEYWNNCDKE